LALLVGLWVAGGCNAPRRDWIATGRCGMVASDSVYASQAGLEMLKAGGNAIDAATAVSFALAVTRPYSTGLGGGGFMIARLADGQVVVLDFRETAPAAATTDMYVRAAQADPARPHASRDGHLAVGVPGLVAGRCQALAQYGTMPLARTLEPAIRLARDGFPIDRHYIESSNDALDRFKEDPSLVESCGYVYRVHLNHGELHPEGFVLIQPQLASLLEELARGGPDFFYRGPVAAAIEREMIEHGGVVRASDLAQYHVRRREAITSTYRDFTIVSMPPPSSGGVAIAQVLNILEPYELSAVYRQDAPLATHLMAEAMKHAFADRARHLADSDFAPVPVELLTSKEYGRRLSEQVDPKKTRDMGRYGSVQLPDDTGTSHFCVVDRWGNVVVSTETINTSFGSLAAVEEWGLILNNEMDDFTAFPGRANVYGLVQSDRNAPAPGKRPLSSMSPTIVLKGDRPYLLLGASGGPRIISSVLNVMISVLDFGMPLDEAISAPRVHHQWQPDEVYFDAAPPEQIAEGLTSRGHVIAEKCRTGIVQAILRVDGKWVGASDPRKGGRPAGY